MTPYEIATLALGTLTLFVGIAVVYIYSGQLEQMRLATEASARSADVAALSLALTQRGYAKFTPVWIAGGDSMLALRYVIAVDGSTPITIESGEMRISIDNPPFPPGMRDRMVAPIPPRTISPKARDVGFDATFPALTPEQQHEWSYGNIEIFLGGEIKYRDAFPKTPVHTKYFGFRWTGKTGWQLNSGIPTTIRNDEEDEH